MAKDNTVISFQSKYYDKWIKDLSKKYYLDTVLLQMKVNDLLILGFDFLKYSDRIFIENYLAINAVSFHTGRMD